MSEKQRISVEDWKNLLTEHPFKLGGVVPITVRPLNLDEIGLLLATVDQCKGDLVKAGVTVDNYTEPLQLLALAKMFFKYIPELIANSGNLALEDVKALPVDAGVGLIRELIKINVEAKEGLVKNLQALAEDLKALIDEDKEKDTENTDSET